MSYVVIENNGDSSSCSRASLHSCPEISPVGDLRRCLGATGLMARAQASPGGSVPSKKICRSQDENTSSIVWNSRRSALKDEQARALAIDAANSVTVHDTARRSMAQDRMRTVDPLEGGIAVQTMAAG